MADEFVAMSHPDKPDQMVRARKVAAMEGLGYSVVEPETPKPRKSTKTADAATKETP